LFAVAVISAIVALPSAAAQRPTAKTETSAAVPRMADGHPDLNGLWNATTVAGPHIASADPTVTNLPSRDGSLVNYERDGALIRRADPNRPLYKPEFWEKVQQLDQNGNEADPSYGCMPAGVPRMGPPDKIVQTPKETVFLYVAPAARGWGDLYRVIPTDGRAHTPIQDLDGTWKGESIGRWDGDTLVIDTIGFNDTSWLDYGGYFHSENMHVIERVRREGDSLIWQATVEDPDVLMKPWVMNPRVQRLNADPKAWLVETLPCVELDLSHLVTKEHH
jgi:hypothetical protein